MDTDKKEKDEGRMMNEEITKLRSQKISSFCIHHSAFVFEYFQTRSSRVKFSRNAKPAARVRRRAVRCRFRRAF
jgi:hypothetical protein